MIQHELKIVNLRGLHARAAAKFVTLASRFRSAIYLKLGEHEVNGKSIMGIMMFAAPKGSYLTLVVEGEDEEAAAEALRLLVEDGFGEELV